MRKLMAYRLTLVSVLITDTQPCSMESETSRFVTTAKQKNVCAGAQGGYLGRQEQGGQRGTAKGGCKPK